MHLHSHVWFSFHEHTKIKRQVTFFNWTNFNKLYECENSFFLSGLIFSVVKKYRTILVTKFENLNLSSSRHADYEKKSAETRPPLLCRAPIFAFYSWWQTMPNFQWAFDPCRVDAVQINRRSKWSSWIMYFDSSNFIRMKLVYTLRASKTNL